MAAIVNCEVTINPKAIQTYNETSLHAAIKNWYTMPGDLIESQVEGYRIDIVRDDLLIEIQVGNFARLKPKLIALLNNHPVRLVHPISTVKWINHIDTHKRRLSPRKGKLDHIYKELVFIAPLLANLNLSLEILFIQEEEIRLNDGRGSWRRKGTSIIDRKLLSVEGSMIFDFFASSRSVMMEYQNREFTSKDLAEHKNMSEHLARKLAYCLHKTGVITITGRRGRHNLYAFHPDF